MYAALANETFANPLEVFSAISIRDVISSLGLCDNERADAPYEPQTSTPASYQEPAEYIRSGEQPPILATVAAAESAGSETRDRSNGWWTTISARLLSASEEAVTDEDLLALLLSYSTRSTNPQRLATDLISRFETFGSVVSARSEQLVGLADGDPDILPLFKLVRAAGSRLAREEISGRPVLDAWDKLIAYLRTTMAHQTVEQFRILFLDRRNVLIADEVQHQGTIDHTPVYPREVVRRALALDASAIIMVHNHPSNHPAPSKPDIEMTRLIRETLERIGIVLHDHIIVSRKGHTSFRTMGLL
jgi:DNA repair protein RadC